MSQNEVQKDTSNLKRTIVADSCCELNEELKKRTDLKHVPFPITLNGVEYQDDGSINISDFVREISRSPEIPKTAGPSPSLFLEAIGEAFEAFVVTISSKLSGTFSNARVAAAEIMETTQQRIHVFDSKSASGGETALAMKVQEWVDNNLPFEEIVEKGEAFIAHLKTYFVLEDLGTMVKSGRIPRLAGGIANKLSIKPICGSDDGKIRVVELKRGLTKALSRMVDIVAASFDDFSDRILYITHINNEERAVNIRDQIMERANFKEAHILTGGGLSTVYANNGGIIIAF